MGIKKFFKKVGGWVKDKFHKATHVVGKVVGKAVPVVKKVVNFVDKICQSLRHIVERDFCFLQKHNYVLLAQSVCFLSDYLLSHMAVFKSGA